MNKSTDINDNLLTASQAEQIADAMESFARAAERLNAAQVALIAREEALRDAQNAVAAWEDEYYESLQVAMKVLHTDARRIKSLQQAMQERGMMPNGYEARQKAVRVLHTDVQQERDKSE